MRTFVDSLLDSIGAGRIRPRTRLSPNDQQRLALPGARAYSEFRKVMLRQRRQLSAGAGALRGRDGAPLFSLVTTVWDTDPAYLAPAIRSVLGQAAACDFEWVILDNGSTRPDTRRALARAARHRQVRLFRADRNLGIVGGMRFCLERASGRYILPFDSDDYLYPDCFAVLVAHLAAMGYPKLAYTDEDKLVGPHFADAYFKPDWDPVLFSSSCYIAHLGVIDRRLALELDAYTDPETEGSHDWDTFTRFFNSGIVPAHIPEVVYSWREHPSSTAGGLIVKPYVYESQRKVLERFLSARQGTRDFRVAPSPLFNGMPDWQFITDAPAARRLARFVVRRLNEERARGADDERGGGASTMQASTSPNEWRSALTDVAKAAAQDHGLIHLMTDDVAISGVDGLEDALAQFDIFPDTAIVGGRIFGPDGRIASAGHHFGFGLGCDCPDKGREDNDPGYFAQMWKPHSVGAVSMQNMVVDARFLATALDSLGEAPRAPWCLGAWLGGLAAEMGRRVVYTPFLTAASEGDVTESASLADWRQFTRRFRHLIPEGRFLSCHLALSRDAAYSPCSQAVRREALRRLGTDGEQTARAGELPR